MGRGISHPVNRRKLVSNQRSQENEIPDALRIADVVIDECCGLTRSKGIEEGNCFHVAGWVHAKWRKAFRMVQS